MTLTSHLLKHTPTKRIEIDFKAYIKPQRLEYIIEANGLMLLHRTELTETPVPQINTPDYDLLTTTSC